jgi:hypothetical protein
VVGVPSPRLFRRVFHLASPVLLFYYWLPECISRPDLTLAQCPSTSVTREGLMLLFLGTALCIETARISLRIPIFGMRGYEAERVSAYAWGAIGLILGFVFFPPVLVVPAFCGMAWIDPLCAWARKTRRYPWLPSLGYPLVFASLLVVVGGLRPLEIGLLTAVATPVAILAEWADIKQVNDDFLMTVVPLAVVTPVYWLTAGLL